MSQKPEKSKQAEIEERMLALWKEEGTFEQSIKQREGQETFSFYDGPPFANGLPHFGHSLVTSIKDSMLRYKTMRGYYVPRRNGWDCHGLPVEFAIEKELGLSGKKQIIEYGIDKFNAACRDSIFRYKDEWERLLTRLGRWSEYDNYYATVDRDYTESVWWALSQINEKGLLYKGYKSTPYCPRCETPLSNFEVNDGYRDDVPDPSLYVKFKLTDEDAYLLGWTTTPWSLPGNAAIAVNPKEQYVYVELKDDKGNAETLVLAKKRLEALSSEDYHITKEVLGENLVGRSYQPLFELTSDFDSTNTYKIWAADFVSIEDGSGVLHVAPAFGEDDLALGQENDIPVLNTISPSGHVRDVKDYDEVNGMFFKKADKYIIEHLTKKGNVYAAETFKHTYPFCWRCETPLLYYAIDSWFIKVSDIRPQLLKTAEAINWTPAHIKTGRFGKWLEGARDWAISRNRYWGAPLPIWVNENDASDYIVVGSIEELKKLAGNDIDVDDLHRPSIDKISFTKDGRTYKRVEEVLDCWFESGCMSIGQQHYPFENKETFDKTFPADFIIEGLDQTRLWFYVQHVVATILFEQPAYRNVTVNGMIMAADGQKLSKRLKNYPPLDEVFDSEGVDSLRLYLLSSTQATQVADYMRFDRGGMKDINRNIISTLLNSYQFFTMYAELDKWQPANPGERPVSTNVLDQWMLARLDETIAETTRQADDYKIAHAITPIFELVDDMSNWFIRRSRRRFWKADDDTDKKQAYETLWYTLLRVAQLLAPWAPFISDHLWRELTKGTELAKSVHLSHWPSVNQQDNASRIILEDMETIRAMISLGLQGRALESINVRKPLLGPIVTTKRELSEGLKQLLEEELNVKSGIYKVSSSEPNGITMNFEITPELKAEGLMRDIVRHVQNARKQAGLNVEDRILLQISSESTEITEAITTFKDTIFTEALATGGLDGDGDYQVTVKVEGQEVAVKLSKA